MARAKTGTIVRVRTGPHKGCLQAILTLADGSRKRLPPFPRGTSEAFARDKAAHYAEEVERRGVKRKAEPVGEKPGTVTSDDCERWVSVWLDDRRAADYTSVRENESHWRLHIRAVLGGKHPRDWTRDDLRALSQSLRDKVRAKTIAAKTAQNVWGTASKMCDDAAAHDDDRIRVRKDGENPAAGVRGPRQRSNNNGADEQDLHFLYPSEVEQFVQAPAVPLQWRALVALAVYTYCRDGELRSLRWEDVDLDHGMVHVHWARDRRGGGVKPTKGMHRRRVPVEPELVPVLQELRRKAGGAGLVVPEFPSERDMARGLRRWLQRAGVGRAELFRDSETHRKLRFHDLRASGITWMAVRGDDPLKIRQRAGHKEFGTTQRYIRLAESLRDGFGKPFGSLTNLAQSITANDREGLTIENLAGRTGLEPAASGVTEGRDP